MAGKRQHYLPRFLLAGFAEGQTGNTDICWVYRKSGATHKANVTKIGVEKFFYGDPETEQTDSVITEAEIRYSEFINRLRTEGLNQEVDSQLAAEFVIHLAVRNRNLREDVSLALETFFGGFADRLEDPEYLRKTVISYLLENPQELERLFRKNVLQGQRLPRRQYKLELARHKAQLPSIINKAPESTLREIAKSLQVFEQHLRPSLKEGHNKAIAANHAPSLRVETLSHLDWTISNLESDSLILSDFGAWAIEAKSSAPSALIYLENEIQVVALPISHQHLLLGTSSASEFNAEPSKINQYSAAISKEFFVSSVDTDDRNQLVSRIGTAGPEVLNRAVEKSLREL